MRMNIGKQRRGNLLDAKDELGEEKIHVKKNRVHQVAGIPSISSPEGGLCHQLARYAMYEMCLCNL